MAIMPVGQQDRQEGIQAGKARLRLPYAAILAGDRAVNMICRDRVDISARNRGPECLAVLGRTQGRVDLTHFGDSAGGVVGQIVQAGFDADLGARRALAERGIKRLSGRGMHRVDRCSGDPREIGRARQCVGLDERRARGIPGRQTVLAVGIGGGDPITQHPCDLDVFGMRAQQAVIGRQHFEETEEKAVIRAGQPKARSFIAANVHEKLGAWASARDQLGQFGQLIFGCDHEVEAEVDPGACLGDLAKFGESRCIGLGAHDKGKEGGYAAERCGSGFAFCILGHTGAGDIHAVAEVDMGIDRAGKHGQAADVEGFAGLSRSRGGNRRDRSIADQNVAALEAGARQECVSSSECKIRLSCHRPPPLLRLSIWAWIAFPINPLGPGPVWHGRRARVAVIGLHPWLLGMPHRIRYPDKGLRRVSEMSGVRSTSVGETARPFKSMYQGEDGL